MYFIISILFSLKKSFFTVHVLDGAPPHTAKESRQWLAANFGDRVISFKTDFVWAPYSPDLNPLGHLKDIVYRECPQTVQELKDLIVDSIQMIDQDKALCRRVIGHFQRRLNVCVEWGGRHIEHVLLELFLYENKMYIMKYNSSCQ